MITRRFLNIYGIVGIVVMAGLLLLIWLKVVPQEYYLPLFVFALVIWVSRLVMRMIIVKKERHEDADNTRPT